MAHSYQPSNSGGLRGDIVQAVVQKVAGEAYFYQGRPTLPLRSEANVEPGRPKQRPECHSEWDVYKAYCPKCKQLCNCLNPQDTTPYPDIFVRSLDKKIVRLSSQLVKASVVLSEEVYSLMNKNNGKHSQNLLGSSNRFNQVNQSKKLWCPEAFDLNEAQLFKLLVLHLSENDGIEKGDFIKFGDDKEVMIVFDYKTGEPTIGVPSKILKKVNKFILKHIDQVNGTRRIAAFCRREQANFYYYEDWEQRMFDVDPSEFLKLKQANVELLIWDFHCTIVKWTLLNRGIPQEVAHYSNELETEDVRRSYNPRYRKRGDHGRSKGKFHYGRRATSAIVEENQNQENCHGNDWNLYLEPCEKCLKFCNCSYTYFPKKYPSVFVRSLDRKVVLLSGELVRASRKLSKVVDQVMSKGVGVLKMPLLPTASQTSLFKGNFIDEETPSQPVTSKFSKKRRLNEIPFRDILEFEKETALNLCDENNPTLGITEEVLLKINHFINMHLEQVDMKVEARKMLRRHVQGVLFRIRYLISDEHLEVNTFAFEDWEEELFNVDPATLMEFRKANQELDILDLHWTLEKWMVLTRGTPTLMENGWYDLFEDSDCDLEDAENVFGLPGMPYCNPRRVSKHRCNHEVEFHVPGGVVR